MRKLARVFAATLLNNVEIERAFAEARDDGIITEAEMDEIEDELIKIANRITEQIGSADTYEMAKQVVGGEI
jgi:hypothetical protein